MEEIFRRIKINKNSFSTYGFKQTHTRKKIRKKVMSKNLLLKICVIIVLVLVAVWTLYPPDKTLRAGIDLAGGVSLTYEIDAEGTEPAQRKGLSTKMIRILRRRIDPANIQNIEWWPQGDTRFEIRMPLASSETRQKRQQFEQAMTNLLDENINPAVILRSLTKPAQERAEFLKEVGGGSPQKLEILNNLAEAHDEYNKLQNQSNELTAKIEQTELKLAAAGLQIDNVKANAYKWSTLNEPKLTEQLKTYLDIEPNSLPDSRLELLLDYVKDYSRWIEITEELTTPGTGKADQYKEARNALDELNLTEEQIKYVLQLPSTVQRKNAIEQLKEEFADRAKKIDALVEAFEDYREYQGRLDDPKDLQNMLKGAGILEFRILPTLGHPDVDTEKMQSYVDRLKSKGPKYSSDDDYIWFELEDSREWIGIDEFGNTQVRAFDNEGRPVIIASFGNKYYVLASNKADDGLLFNPDEPWELKGASPGRDTQGRRAIDFELDDRAGKIFAKVTDKNMYRPLCIILDDIAISAPVIQSRISTSGKITDSFSQEEVENMVNKLEAGHLPAQLIEQPISVKSIGPSLGAENRDQGIKAGFIGLIVVIGCMAIYYTLAGSIADLALLLNILFVLAIMAFSRATFTLPGIAGIILTIGMSVDANVLIFERIREEQKKGSSLSIAIKNGYQRAFRTIFDANLTTFITAAILRYVATEELKGFAIVLMLGIVSSMFTALFVTRVIFDILVSKQIIKDRLFMLQLIERPNVNWMKLRPAFLVISGAFIITGLVVFYTTENKYDIEFTGGTSVVMNLKDGVELTRRDVEDRIHKVGEQMNNPALATANVYSTGKPITENPEGEKKYSQYEIKTIETNKIILTITLPTNNQQTADKIISTVGDQLSNLNVKPADKPNEFVISTSQTNKTIVKNVLEAAFPDAQLSEPQLQQTVNDAILAAFQNDLQIMQNLQPQITSVEKITEDIINQHPELSDFISGIKITCKLTRSATPEEISSRFQDLRFKPEMRDIKRYPFELFNADLTPLIPSQPVDEFVYVSVNEDFAFGQPPEDEWNRFMENERTKVLSSMQLSETLPRVTQINPSIGEEAKIRALIAIILSLAAIVAYIWIRFGNARYGFAAILALVHDVCITLGAITACTFIANTKIGEILLIGDFKINLAIIAAFLTLIGYSLNDTIVVFDRIRENRRKAQLTTQTITNSINQTLSRTLLTSFTTFIVVLIMYIFGGQALRGFTFAIGFGVIIGTYSSIAIAAPILLLGTKTKTEKK